MRTLVVVFAVCAVLCAAKRYNTHGTRKAGVLNVHIISHTHNDVGWLKTADEYYYGANETIQIAGVQYILDTVVSELMANPNRKFTYVETGFFARWWDEQDSTMRQNVQTLVNNGQLVFANGGWSMHDEANPHYQSMVDQTTYGHQFLLNALGVIPLVGWQIDPFGHTGTQASLLTSVAGFNSLFYARIDYQDEQQRIATHNLEFAWQGSPSLGATTRILSGAFVGGTYCPPSGFDWSVNSNNDPVMDDPTLEGYNVPMIVDNFVQTSQSLASAFQGNDVMFLMGCDFEYNNAHHWYKNLDKLIHYVNLDGRVNVFYSNPEEYTMAKYNDSIQWQLKTDDFMPLENAPHAFWSGFFTSRATLKRWTRDNAAWTQAARQIAISARITSGIFGSLFGAIGLATHHDAITGTEKQHVAFDYAKQLSVGRAAAMAGIVPGLQKVTGSSAQWGECQLLNMSVCAQTQNLGLGTNAGNATIVVWNAMSQAQMTYVRIPVAGQHLTVSAGDNNNYASFGYDTVSPIYNNYAPAVGGQAVLVAALWIPPMSFRTVILVDHSSKFEAIDIPRPKVLQQGDGSMNGHLGNYVLQSNYYTLTFDQNGNLQSATNRMDGSSIDLTQEWGFYPAMNQPNQQGSGAYIMRPSNNTLAPIAMTGFRVTYSNGVSSIQQNFSNWISQTIRLYNDSEAIEVEMTVGPIPVDDGIGKEVISRFSSSVNSNDVSYTDSNGREMEYRKRNWRQSFNFTQTEPVAGNYFPTVTHAFINDGTNQLTVLTETSQASGSINSGQLEFLVQRRILGLDHFGVGEPLNETQFITPYTPGCNPCGHHYGPGLIHRTRHWVMVNKQTSAARSWRPMLDKIFYQPRTFISTNAGPLPIPATTLLKANLTDQVQVMTLELINSTTYLLRLSHQYAVGEDPTKSVPVTIDISNLFNGITFSSAVEMTLTANRPLANWHPLQWKIQGETTPPPPRNAPSLKGTMVTLQPMEIRTFYCNL